LAPDWTQIGDRNADSHRAVTQTGLRHLRLRRHRIGEVTNDALPRGVASLEPVGFI
jgi:hypothetical protein